MRTPPGPPRQPDPPAADAHSVWFRVRAAVPLSRVFADRLGEPALHRTSAPTKFKVVCPFHNDRNPSLHIDDSLGLFHCFACGAKGSLIDFEQLSAGHRSVSTALRSLAAKYPPIAAILRQSSLRLSSPSPGNAVDAHQSHFSRIVKPRVPRRVRLTQLAIANHVLRDALAVYTSAFWDPVNPDALNYLRHDRGLSLPTLRAFSCGFALPHAKRAFLLSHLSALSHAPEDAVLAGIARGVFDTNIETKNASPDKKKPTRFYDSFRARVVFPIRAADGAVLSFAARVLPGASSREPKYINGADSPLFSKRDVLFGADLAASAHSATVENGFVIVVEGYLDAMAVFDRTEGRIACVATMGTAASPAQLKAACKLLTDTIDGKVIINFDADDAGMRALERLCDSVIPQITDFAHAIHIAVLPSPFKDPDEYLSQLNSDNSHEYVDMVLLGAIPWYQWRGDSIVQQELSRMEGQQQYEDSQIQLQNRNGYGMKPLSSMAEIERAMEHVEDEAEFSVLMSDFLKVQRDDLALAFGANEDDIKNTALTEYIPPKCSDAVIDSLAALISQTTQYMPWLNAPALAQSWADALSHSTPRVLIPLCKRILNRAEEYAAPWAELSLPVQMFWMRPAPWILGELPVWKRKSMGYGATRIPKLEENTYVEPVQLEGVNLSEEETAFRSQGRDDETMDSAPEYLLSEDPQFMKRCLKRLEAQGKAVLPFLEARQCERAKRLKLAPRRSAEEIILRALIFASEADRLTALQKLLDVVIRCGEREMPFWTCANRERLFEYLVSVEGEPGIDEMGAYLEEFEWFTPEIEELLIPNEEEADAEWQEVREIELSAPVKVVESIAHSVETMARKVAGRLALDRSGQLLQELVEKKTEMERNKGRDDQDELEREVELLAEKQQALVSQIDGSKFLSPAEIAKREEAANKREQNREMERQMELFWKELSETGGVAPPEDLGI